METAILWNVTPCRLVDFYSLREKPYAYKNSCPKLKNLEVTKKQNSIPSSQYNFCPLFMEQALYEEIRVSPIDELKVYCLLGRNVLQSGRQPNCTASQCQNKITFIDKDLAHSCLLDGSYRSAN
jgi:hypothetical protein